LPDTNHRSNQRKGEALIRPYLKDGETPAKALKRLHVQSQTDPQPISTASAEQFNADQ